MERVLFSSDAKDDQYFDKVLEEIPNEQDTPREKKPDSSSSAGELEITETGLKLKGMEKVKKTDTASETEEEEDEDEDMISPLAILSGEVDRIGSPFKALMDESPTRYRGVPFVKDEKKETPSLNRGF